MGNGRGGGMKMSKGFLYTLLFLVHIISFISHFALVLSWKFHLYPLILYNYTPIQTQSLLNFLSFYSPLFLLIRGRMVIVPQKKNSLENSRNFVLGSSPRRSIICRLGKIGQNLPVGALSSLAAAKLLLRPSEDWISNFTKTQPIFKATIQPTQHTNSI